MFRIFCDSACELDIDIVQQLKLDVIKMPYIIQGQQYFYDMGKSFCAKNFFDKMRDGIVITTARLNLDEYIDIFEPVLSSGEDIVYLTFSQAMSGTFEVMNAAIDVLRDKYKERKIVTIDTKNISIGAGLIIYLSTIGTNLTVEELTDKTLQNLKRIKTYFVVDDLVYLRRGGRIGAVKATVGGLLNIKPIIQMTDDGTLNSVGKGKGKRKALLQMLELFKKASVDTSVPIVVSDADSKDDAKILVDGIKSIYKDATVWTQSIGPIVGSHCGPGTVGLIFATKTDK